MLTRNHQNVARPAGNFSFRRLEEADLELLMEWMNRPHVANIWDTSETKKQVRDKYLRRISSSYVFPYLALLDGRPVGYIQSYIAKRVGKGWWPGESEGTWGIDQFLADPALLGQGYGAEMIRRFVEKMFGDAGVDKIVCDPKPSNLRAIHCYERVGFRPLGLIETPDGPAMRMELGREEFVSLSPPRPATAII